MILLEDDFSAFHIGPFPFDHEHSAMGEYHYAPNKGYCGRWYDPIDNPYYRGPSWMVTGENGVHLMEQTRVRNASTNGVMPMLVAGDEQWDDYLFQVRIKLLCTSEEAGIAFRYQTSLAHYLFVLNRQQAEVWKIDQTERSCLKSVPFAYNCDTFYTLSVRCSGADFICGVDGRELIRVTDTQYQYGKIALCGYMPAQFADVRVECDASEECAYIQKRDEKEARINLKRGQYPKPKLWKIINFHPFGASRQIRFGHLTGTGEMYLVIAQHQKRVFKERYCNISCLTAVGIDSGAVLWQIGEPSSLPELHDTTCDLPFQVYDINGDGEDEVILAKDFHIMILEGKTGRVLRRIPTPYNDEPADEIVGIEFQKHAFDRLNVDAIRIVNVSGNARPSDILIKDRYARLWVFNSRLELLWKFSHNNTGHFPFAYDFNGDGKDEILSCYNMIDSAGHLMWELPVASDHVDEIIVARFRPEADERIAVVAGWEGFMLIDKAGNILTRHVNGHAQRISAGNYCPEKEGVQICTTTYWENQGIVYLYDCDGNEIWHMEPSSNGNIIAPVNWRGDGGELILLNGNMKYGGMIDGEGDRVVTFPDDGHPDQCAEVMNLTGDARDEILLWDSERMYIYTQDRPADSAAEEYRPIKYPLYNGSNYRGEYSFPPEYMDACQRKAKLPPNDMRVIMKQEEKL